MKNTLYIILGLLALHLLYTNSQLLMVFMQERTWWSELLRILFASSYSIITVLIVAIFPKRYVYLISGVLDGASVLLNYAPVTDKFWSVSVLFGIYTAFIAVIIGEISKYKATERTEQKELTRSELIAKRISLQNSVNRMRDSEARARKLQELENVKRQLAILEEGQR